MTAAAPPTTKQSLSELGSSPAETTQREWLGALTSLRFFAAAVVVCVHFRPLMPDWLIPHLDLVGTHAVTLFFVLSGFVLIYNYRDIAGRSSILNFYRARIARVYPMHWLTLAIMFCIQGHYLGLLYPQVLVANAMLLQDWFPFQAMFFSYDAPSWSLSCEIFFYLCFPFLIKNFAATWKKKLICALSVALLIVCTAQAFLQKPVIDAWAIDGCWFVYCCPLTRLAEFLTGMVAGFAFINHKSRIHLSHPFATFIEIGLCALYIGFCCLQKTFVPAEINKVHMYLTTSGVAPLFGAMMLVLALRQGLVSRILNNSVLVYLGEISLGVYLIHGPILDIYNSLKPVLTDLSTEKIAILLWLMILSASALCRELLEVPARKLIKGQQLAKPRLKTSIIVAVSLCVCSAVTGIVAHATHNGFDRKLGVNSGDLAQRKQTSLIRPSVVHVGESLILESVNCRQATDGGADLILTWKNARDACLNKCVAVHLYDTSGHMRAAKDFVQTPANLKLREAQVWSDTVHLSTEDLKATSALYIGVYTKNPIRLEPIHWDGSRPSPSPYVKVEQPFIRQ